MAKFIIDNVTYEVPDGSKIEEVCEEAGIPFSCNSGVCGSCEIKILEGAENLNDLDEEEQDLGLDRNNRLSCRCIINSGTVKVTY